MTAFVEKGKREKGKRMDRNMTGSVMALHACMAFSISRTTNKLNFYSPLLLWITYLLASAIIRYSANSSKCYQSSETNKSKHILEWRKVVI
jgi:hypothetical protein